MVPNTDNTRVFIKDALPVCFTIVKPNILYIDFPWNRKVRHFLMRYLNHIY